MIKKINKSKLFSSVIGDDKEKQDRQNFIIDSLTQDDLNKIMAADLDKGYEDSTKEKMEFINRLPYEYKVKWIEEIENNLSPENRLIA